MNGWIGFMVDQGGIGCKERLSQYEGGFVRLFIGEEDRFLFFFSIGSEASLQ